jgi:hypothetical protein
MEGRLVLGSSQCLQAVPKNSRRPQLPRPLTQRIQPDSNLSTARVLMKIVPISASDVDDLVVKKNITRNGSHTICGGCYVETTQLMTVVGRLLARRDGTSSAFDVSVLVTLTRTLLIASNCRRTAWWFMTLEPVPSLRASRRSTTVTSCVFST